MPPTELPKNWLADAKAFHFLFLPGILFWFIASACAILYFYALGPSVLKFLYEWTSFGWPLLRLFLATAIPIVICGSVFAGLYILHLHKYKGLLVEELRHLSEPAGWEELLTCRDPSRLFQRLADTCKALGFQQVAMTPGKALLAVRTQHYGLGSLDVIEVRPGAEETFVVVARPLLPSRVGKSRYKNMIEQLKEHLS